MALGDEFPPPGRGCKWWVGSGQDAGWRRAPEMPSGPTAEGFVRRIRKCEAGRKTQGSGWMILERVGGLGEILERSELTWSRLGTGEDSGVHAGGC